MSKARALLIVLVPAILPNCEARESDADFWRNEREIIELAQRLKLAEYRLGLSEFRKAGELDDLKARLSENEARLSDLQAQRASLAVEVQNLEQGNKKQRGSALQQKRMKALGMKFETLPARDGRTFSNVTITKVDDAGVAFRHEHGAARLRYSELSDDKRSFFGLEESTALAAEQKEISDALAYERQIDLEMEEIWRRESMAASLEKAYKPSQSTRSLASVSPRQLRTSKLSEPAKAFGTSPTYRSYYYSGYRSYRPVYRYYYRYPTCPTPSYCPSSRTRSYSSGFSSSACPPSVTKTP